MEPGEKQLWQQQTLHLTPGGAGVAAMRDQYQDGLKLLLVAAGCVLLVACGNLANLMLARGLKDRGQTSVRVALGASRQRLVRKALVESLLLAVIGGVLGIGVAYAGTRLILHLAFQIGGPNNYRPHRCDAILASPALHFSDVGADRSHLRDRTGVDDLARRPDRSVTRRKPFGGWPSLVGAKVTGDRAGGDVAGVAVGGSAARPEPAESRTPELRIRDGGPVYRVDQSDVGQLQTRAAGADVPED